MFSLGWKQLPSEILCCSADQEKVLCDPLTSTEQSRQRALEDGQKFGSFHRTQLTEPEKVMLHLKCVPETCKRYVLLRGKSDALGEVLESIKFYDSHIRLIEYDKQSEANAKAFWTEETIAAFNRGKGKKGKGKEGLEKPLKESRRQGQGQGRSEDPSVQRACETEWMVFFLP